jgi:hypothetical protein
MASVVSAKHQRDLSIHADSRAREKGEKYPEENTVENGLRARKNIPLTQEI